jgi:hypothetical protein
MKKILLALSLIASPSLAVELDEDFMLFNWLDAESKCANTGECVERDTLAWVIRGHGLCVHEKTGILIKGKGANNGSAFCQISN